MSPGTVRQILDRSWFWILRYHPELQHLSMDSTGAEAHFGHVTDEELVEKGWNATRCLLG